MSKQTLTELSIVVPDTLSLASDSCDAGWRILEVLGPLQLSMVGIMASISSVLAKARVSIFVVSTFETDYFLVKQPDLERGIQALQQDGYKVD
ncbi:ACT domain-containing protein [Bowmanella yangjiangensis]|uniref:ACT domain-containing protein n=1 Tax=Bowmanella yangjiangensis TaxID=2811230 RepID=A0ABS3CRU5_9ALTE|nr:ACT domain-containing protein [Bowmanella yangjiangensis]MBN7819833.1 ACT domain-containing protein [Bowmanella yangjiangensis]